MVLLQTCLQHPDTGSESTRNQGDILVPDPRREVGETSIYGLYQEGMMSTIKLTPILLTTELSVICFVILLTNYSELLRY